MKSLVSIGRAEHVDIIGLDLKEVPAKVDTGADTSSIWVSNVQETVDGLRVVFFGPGSPYYTGQAVLLPRDYHLTRVANSFGHKELRYKVKLKVRIKGRLIRATFTLSDRSQKSYPILLGRRLLQSKFIVDVSKGTALQAIERAKARRLRHELSRMEKGQA